MRFLVDAQLPPALARMLVDAGHVAEHVGDVGLRDANDTAIWRHALATGATVITKDEDFAQRKQVNPAVADPPVVWLRVGNTSRRALLAWFGPMLPQIEIRLAAGDDLVEVV